MDSLREGLSKHVPFRPPPARQTSVDRTGGVFFAFAAATPLKPASEPAVLARLNRNLIRQPT